jgi:SMI1-KNR4 cell-wall
MITKEVMHQSLIEKKLAKPNEIVGCSISDIQELKTLITGELPYQYVEFLRAVGKHAGLFFRGTRIYFPEIFSLRSAANNLLIESQVDFNLPPLAFVFCMHQGYEFDYFILGSSDDPEVYRYTEGNLAPEKIFDCFSEYFVAAVDMHVNALYGTHN